MRCEETICLTLFCRGGRKRQPWWSILYSTFLHRLFWHTGWLICTSVHILSSGFFSYLLLLAWNHLSMKDHIFSAHIITTSSFEVYLGKCRMNSSETPCNLKLRSSFTLGIQKSAILSRKVHQRIQQFKVKLASSLILQNYLNNQIEILNALFLTDCFLEEETIIDHKILWEISFNSSRFQ